ncbi:MAG: hypothetical protein LBS70_06885 [Candidatus Accumulibacter sp.]|jgi:hypothetical protein|nr:hypothetical protein [Accumulibacter sp.]
MTTHFFASPDVGFSLARRNPRKFRMRRFAPEFYASGFRVKPGMTTHFFASPGVGFGLARRNPRKTGMRRGAPERRIGGPSSALRKPPGKPYARRSEERAAIEETLRHSGLDPESSS